MHKNMNQLFISIFFLLSMTITVAQAQMTPPGNALSFDGIDDYVQTGIMANSTNFPKWTIECWVKGTNAPSGTQWDGPIYGDASFGILWDHVQPEFRGAASVCVGRYYPASFGPLSGGTWYHLAATYDGSYLRAYKDGQLITSTYAPGTSYNDRNPVVIGSHPVTSNGHFQGLVDEVRIWNVVRSQSSIRDAMYNVISSSSSGLVAYYRFDQTNGTTLPNLVSSNYTGTLINGPTWVESYAMVVPYAYGATNIAKRSFTANWIYLGVGVIEKYYLDVSTSEDFSSIIPGYYNKDVGTSRSYNVTGLNPNTHYYYRIRAYKSSVGYSGYSNPIGYGTTIANRMPIANAGADQIINCAPKNGSLVNLNGSGSNDLDNDPLTYTWTEGGIKIATGALPAVNLAGGVHTIRLTVNDGDGGIAYDDVVITVNVDNTAPVPDVAQLPVVSGECSVTLIPPTATDNCSGKIIGTTSQPLSYLAQGTYVVTWVYTDANGNSVQQNQSVIVKDVTPPVLTVPSALATYRNSAEGYAGPIGTATATDNCSSTPAITNDAPQLFPLGITKVTWKATDAVGNFLTAEQSVTVINQVPVANAGTDQQFDCVAIAGMDVTLNGSNSSDADGDQLTYSWSENGSVVAEGSSPTIHLGDGVHSLVLKVNDGHNGESSDEVQISVHIDKAAPVMTIPQDIIVETNVSGGYVGNIGTGSAMDECEGQTAVTNNAPQTFPIGITNVTWTSQDSKGNTARVNQKVTVTTRPPIANAGSDQIFDCALKSGVTTHLDASASHDPDNDPLAYAWTEGNDTIATGANPQVTLLGGIHTMKLIVTDGFGGIAIDEMIVTVQVDTIAPKITAPIAVTKIANIAGGYKGDIGTPTALDNCGASPAITNNAPTIFPLGSTKVIWKATDANGNSSTAEQLVTVNPIPVIVDVKPGSDDNSINLKSKGKIPVAILSCNGFDAATVDMMSVKLGPNQTPVLMGNLEDVDHDGDLDLMIHFDIQSIGITQTDTQVELIGKTKSGIDIKGSDKITLVGKLKKEGSEDDVAANVPKEFSLSQNYPNPFNPTTTIRFTLAEDGMTSLKVYDVIGRETALLVNGYLQAGVLHQVTFDASRLVSGLYFYKLDCGRSTQVKKLVLLR